MKTNIKAYVKKNILMISILIFILCFFLDKATGSCCKWGKEPHVAAGLQVRDPICGIYLSGSAQRILVDPNLINF